MCAGKTQFAVFVKPWKSMALPELAQHVRHLGFDRIELPVRPGFAVEPEAIERNGLGYWEAEAKARRQLEAALPFCHQYAVKIGIQHHYGGSVPINSMGLHHLLQGFDPAYIGAIWDPSHNALQGEDPVTGLEIVQSHLCMVNLKNAFWKRVNGPEAETAEWKAYFTSGRTGLSSWAQVAEGVRKVGYAGPITFSAEYSAEHDVNRLIVEDLAYAKELFN
jgi:sugar phosphate isomerase/epimerase